MSKERYLWQWMTRYVGANGRLVITGYCVRDMANGGVIVFEHPDVGVCQKMEKLLNEG